MNKFICNTSALINWKSVIRTIESNESLAVYQNFYPEINDTGVVPRVFSDDLYLETDEKNYATDLYYAGYDWKNVWWHDFNINEFDFELVEKFQVITGKKFLRCFVSRISPGICVPRHWDEGDVQFRKDGIKEMFRYACFIHPHIKGQAFLVGDESYYNVPVGDLYEWGHHTYMHGIFNASDEYYYVFHYLGY